MNFKNKIKRKIKFSIWNWHIQFNVMQSCKVLIRTSSIGELEFGINDM